ncbi:hypothetical protein GCM10022419_038550 [Nonomuraea rosea]|uniref:Uncharacterized protein n=1 Tax=Nonomuraea rosea TaxID=638574 RepID=A0ABP6WR83_9ACTN
MSVKQQVITDEQWQHARTIWDYHQMHHDLRRCHVAIGLGSHDLGVARAAAEFYHAGWFSLLVFSGATRGERSQRLADLAWLTGATTYLCGTGGMRYLAGPHASRRAMTDLQTRLAMRPRGERGLCLRR